MSAPPVVYIFHGDDQVGIEKAIASIRERMGDTATADMNTTRLKGRVETRDLQAAVRAVPFLSERRLIVLDSSVGGLRSKADREDLAAVLEGVPASTALVIIEHELLKSDHWLLKWAGPRKDSGQVHLRAMPLPRGGALVKWVMDYTREQGGEMTPQAAHHLVGLVGDDNRHAASEADKLLAYVGYARPVDVDDVDMLTAAVRQADVFDMVDALGRRDGRQALSLLQDLLATRDAITLFGMIIRQVRLLLLYKEAQADRIPPAEIAQEIGVHPYVASKLGPQSANFDIAGLEQLFFRLEALDHQIKTGGMEVEIALNTFVAEVTIPGRSPR